MLKREVHSRQLGCAPFLSLSEESKEPKEARRPFWTTGGRDRARDLGPGTRFRLRGRGSAWAMAAE
jgi:hypothetical protein